MGDEGAGHHVSNFYPVALVHAFLHVCHQPDTSPDCLCVVPKL